MLVIRRRRSRQEALNIGSNIKIVAHPGFIEIHIGEIEIWISEKNPNILKISIEAPEDVLILREELCVRGQQEKEKALD